jgi:hypothetical protein
MTMGLILRNGIDSWFEVLVFSAFFLSPNDERVHPYQRGRASIMG